jgi:choline dehydrogenase-like flavoprotein
MHPVPASYLDQVLAGKLDGRHITVRGQDYPVRMSSTPAGRNSVPRYGYAPVGAPGNPQLGERCEGNTNCIPICPVQAKYSSLKTWYELMRRHPGDQPPTPTRSSVRIVPQAVATKVELDEHGRVSGITYQAYDDEAAAPAPDPRTARGTIYVPAANAIENATLLLASGAANSSGMVGRNLMVHVQTTVIGRFPEHTGADHGPWGATATTRHFYETDPSRDFKRGFIVTAMRGFDPLDTALQTASWGEGHHAALEHHLNHEAVCWVCGDDEPEPHNRVELDHERTDGFGLPGVVTHYTLSENSRRIGEAGIEKATELCYAAGADSVRVLGFDTLLGWHLLGTARMGSDPDDSVVDAWHRCHDVPNLLLVDGSVMATGASVNPTHTVQALALRAADGIWARRREG